jgi:hypothetical protein
MNLTKLSAIAEIVGSVAVLATLIYLTIQVQQNTRVLEATSRQAALDNATSILALSITDPGLWLLSIKPNLTDEERVKLSSFLFLTVERGRTNWNQYRAGALDEAAWLDVEGPLIGTLAKVQARKWWAYYAPGFEAGFRDRISGLLAAAPIETTMPDVAAFD